MAAADKVAQIFAGAHQLTWGTACALYHGTSTYDTATDNTCRQHDMHIHFTCSLQDYR